MPELISRFDYPRSFVSCFIYVLFEFRNNQIELSCPDGELYSGRAELNWERQPVCGREPKHDIALEINAREQLYALFIAKYQQLCHINCCS